MTFSRGVEPRRSKLDLTDFVPKVTGLLFDSAEELGGAIELIVPPPPVWVEADGALLHAVISNLAGNALDAATSGAPSPRVEVRVDVRGSTVYLRVCDNGPGVSSSMKPRLFEPFQTEKANGVGIGLALARKIARAHGGELDPRRERRRGARISRRELRAHPAAASGRSGGFMRPSVLVVDDERSFRLLAEEALSSEGFDVRTASTLARARMELDKTAPDVMILDRRLPDGDGIDLLRELASTGQLTSQVIVVTAYADVNNAVEALRAGAVDYLTKPLQVTDLIIKLRKVLETRGLRDRLALAKNDGKLTQTPPRSPAAREVSYKLEQVAESPLTPVFLVGPSGAGKQFAAEMLHKLSFSDRPDGAPFVEVNCAALPAHLVESELFGHERGAFTDAKAMRRGLIELADGGTLFLDEITELPEPSQAKLLKFLDTMRFRRLGGQREIEVSLRVVAATNRDVSRLDPGRFREDLYHRLAVFLVNIPPLAKRREDIPELVESFVRYFAGRVKKRITGITPGAMAALAAYDYPGNVRELRNIIERAIILTTGPEIGERDVILPERRAHRRRAGPLLLGPARRGGQPPSLDQLERAYVARVLDHHGGKRNSASQALGISYPTLLKRLRRPGLSQE